MQTYDCKFIRNAQVAFAELTSFQGITTFDKKSENPFPDRPYLVQVGCGYQAFKTRHEARRYYNAP